MWSLTIEEHFLEKWKSLIWSSVSSGMDSFRIPEISCKQQLDLADGH